MLKGKILVVDDDAFFRSLYKEILTDGGYDVIAASSGSEALEIVETGVVDIVITDLMMPDIDGQEVLERTKQHNALIDVVLITGHGSIESAISALKSGAFDYIRKPINQDELLLTINRCVEQKKIVDENQGLRQSLKLFEVSRTISSCLDIDKLYDLTLDAMMQEIPADAGLCLFFSSDMKSLDVKSIRNIDEAASKKAAALVQDNYSDAPQRFDKVSVVDLHGLKGNNMDIARDYDSLIVAPLRRENLAIGFLALLSKSSNEQYSAFDLKNASFIVEQASLSFENAVKFSKAKELAYVDSLTELYNPRFLDIAIEREIKRSNRSKVPFTVLFMDLDHFKSVNDVNGHLVGSKVLVEVSGLLLNCVRDIDTVIRYGGDEYTIILVDTDHDRAYKVAERIRKSIEGHKFLKDENLALTLTTSIGLASYPEHAGNKRELLEMADKAMYCGKNRSRNTVYMANELDQGNSV